jgi:hypothetical protein
MDIVNVYPKLPKSMKNVIRNEINFLMNEIIKEIFDKY